MSQPVADGPVMSRTAFIGAWTLASLMNWITPTLLWRISFDIPVAESAAAILFGANAGEAGAERAYRILHMVAFHVGNLLTLLIEAWLLRQFRDDTRWWWILGMAAALLMELVYAVAPGVAGGPLAGGETMVLRVFGYLLWAAVAWRLIRHWKWQDRYWLRFHVVVALALPLVDHLCDAAPLWAMMLYAQAGVGDYAARHVLGQLSTGLLEAILVAAPLAWLLWQYVVVRRPVDAPPRGA